MSSKKYQVFISSTFSDLANERARAIDTVVNRQHIPVALERFPATDQSVPGVIRKTIEQCQIYLVILGHRYGSIVPGKDISYTELEYDFAVAQELTVIPLVLNDDEIAERVRAFDDNDRREQDNIQRRREFHAKVKANRLYKPFSGTNVGFGASVLSALIEAEQLTDGPGWVREPEELELRDFVQSVSRNPFIIDVVKQLSNLSTLDARCLEQAEKKRALANFFVREYYGQMPNRQTSLFFESGSTIAYVAKAIGSSLSMAMSSSNGNGGNGNGGNDNVIGMKVATNNVLAFLQLWLMERIGCALFPWGAPETKYGASFGRVADLIDPYPTFPPKPVGRNATAEIDRLLAAPFSFARWPQSALLLGATSGLQLGDKHSFRHGEIDRPESREQCKGPHVGSYQNKIFKRFMYESKLPIMVFLTSDKIDCEIDVKKCHFIFDSDLPWEKIKGEYPLAFCVGCLQDEMADSMEKFKQAGFNEIMPGPAQLAYSAFIARNKAFVEGFEVPNDIIFR